METGASQNEILVALAEDIQSAPSKQAKQERVVSYLAAVSQLSPSPNTGRLVETVLAFEGGAARRVAAIAGEPEVTTIAELLDQLVRVHGEAQAQIYREPMLDAAGVAEVLGSRSKNPRELVMRLRRANQILAVPKGRHHVYPAFQFDLKRRRVHPVVLRVAELLDAGDDPWGVVSWWLTPNARLEHAPTPKELLDQPGGPGIIERLAEAVVEEVG